MIAIEDLWYTYPGRNEPTLKGIDLTIQKDEFVLITGPTGCGKSTLLKTLNGIIPHESAGEMKGNVHINGMSTRDSGMAQLGQLTGLVFQNPDDQIFSTIVEDEIAFGPENLCLQKSEIDRRVRESLRMVGMSDHRFAQTTALSGGQKQRICIASMLAMLPQVMALDEPISQMDPKGASEVMQTIRDLNRKLGLTIVLVEHRVHEIAHLVDRIIVMDCGKIVLDEPAETAFEHIEVFRSLGLRVPETVELFHKMDFESYPLRVEESIKILRGQMEKQNNISASSLTTSQYGFYTSNDISNDGGSFLGECNTGNPVISIRDVWFGYEKDKTVLKGIDLDIHKGGRVALMGANGSGKSTLLHHLSAMLKPGRGDVEVFGYNTRSKDSYSFASKVGLVFQNPDLMLFCDSVEEEVRFAPSNLGYGDIGQKTANSMRSMAILDLQHDLPQALSRGQRLRVAVASILSMQPQLILLDEPTTGQDKMHIEQMMDYFTGDGTTLVFCTHDIETAMRYATRIIVMSDGVVIADGNGREIFSDTEILDRTSLKQPPVMQIARSLGFCAFSVDELAEGLGKLI
ncbi:MAG: ATP-binding cassette domain-containing protein [Methanosarcinales archaeon]|nr:ATP-binding cassette domain-containing protein [Methanosarcinales archaeon]